MIQASPTVSCLLFTPVGQLCLVANDEALLSVKLVGDSRSMIPEAVPRSRHPILGRACDELVAYFQGHLQHFTVPLAQVGTPFQREVWAALRTIPYGERRSYAWLAKEIGRPRAVRAVGAANGRNALAIIVPCHRVIGSSGALTGYAGGLDMKRWLLTHELEMQAGSTAQPGPHASNVAVRRTIAI